MATFHRKNGKSKDYLTRSLNSILNQTYKHWTIIIISDKYEPEHELDQIISDFRKKTTNQIYYLSNANPERLIINNRDKLWRVAGATSMNMGLQFCRKNNLPYYCHLDDDDYWSKDHLEHINNIYMNHKNCVFTSSKSTFFNRYLPNLNVNADSIIYPPTPQGMIHSSLSFRCDLINVSYFTSTNEANIAYPSDYLLLSEIKTFLDNNKQYISIFINKLTCFHDTEGESSY
jgi:glycosyltransferase involved in cell wall biosynthesis